MQKQLFCTILIIILLMPIGVTISATQSTPITQGATTVPTCPLSSLANEDKIQAAMNLVNATLIQEVLETLVSYAPRYTGTYACEKSADYLYSTMSQMNVDAQIQKWTAFGNQYNRKILTGKNIEAVLPGINPQSDDVLTLTAHYDSATQKNYKKQGVFSPGADDDASGVAAVLAAAQALSHFTFNHTIKLAVFPGEEVGLLGSRAYAKQAFENDENIILNLNADMIGYAPSAEDGNRLKMYGSEDTGWAMNVLENISDDYSCGFTEVYRGDIPKIGEGWGADCLSFINYGYESVTFFEGGSYPYAHTPNDKLENVNISYLVKVTKLYVATLAYLADNGNTHPEVRITSPMRGKIYVDEEIRQSFDYGKPAIMFLNKFYWKAATSYSPTIVVNDIWVWTEVYPGSAPVTYAEFYYDGVLAYVDEEPPFSWHLTYRSLRNHEITVIVHDENEYVCQDSLLIRFINVQSEL
jgi:hypothetical protein